MSLLHSLNRNKVYFLKCQCRAFEWIKNISHLLFNFHIYFWLSVFSCYSNKKKKKLWPKLGEEEKLFGSQVYHEGKPRQELRTSPGSRKRGKDHRAHCLLPCFAWLTKLAFLDNPGSPYQRCRVPCSPDHPTSFINKENGPQTCSQASLTEAIEVASF